MNTWKIKNKLIKFPKEWNKKKVLEWINNNESIRVCPICEKIDVDIAHFNTCSSSEQTAIKMNRDMSSI